MIKNRTLLLVGGVAMLTLGAVVCLYFVARSFIQGTSIERIPPTKQELSVCLKRMGIIEPESAKGVALQVNDWMDDSIMLVMDVDTEAWVQIKSGHLFSNVKFGGTLIDGAMNDLWSKYWPATTLGSFECAKVDIEAGPVVSICGYSFASEPTVRAFLYYYER